MASILNWSTTPGDNATADPDINFAEGQVPSTINNSNRQAMARLAAWLADTAPIRASTGATANAYNVTLTSDHASYANKQSGVFRAHQTNTGACSINVNGWGIKALRRVSGQDLDAGEIESGYIVRFHYLSASDEVLIEGAPFRGATADDVADYVADYITDNSDTVRTALRAPITVASATTTGAPSGATDGTRYIVPSGASGSTWASNIGKIAVASSGSWTYLTPAEGWAAFAKDTDTLYVYDTAWNAIVAEAVNAAMRQTMIVRYEQPNGTNGGAATSGSRQTYPLNAVVNSSASNYITGATLSTYKISGLPVGFYDIFGAVQIYTTGVFHLYLYNVTTSTDILVGPSAFAQVSGPVMAGTATLLGSFEVTNAAHEYVIQYRCETTTGSVGLGNASSFSDGVEVFGQFQITSAATEVGATGATGASGANGAGYLASSASSNSISTGSKTFTTSSGLAYQAGDNIRVSDAADPTVNYLLGSVTSYSSTTLIVEVATAVGSGTKTSWTIGLAGSAGATGAAGANGTDSGLRWSFDDSVTTNADPGTGNLRLNNASLASATEIAISYSTGETGNPSAETWVKAWDDSTNTAHYGALMLKKASATENFVSYRIASVITDGTTYGRFTLADGVAAGSFADGDVLAVQFVRTGNKGADGAGSGTVTSVALAVPAEFSVSGSPVTSSGTITVSRAAQTANTVCAGPTTGAPAAPTFRAIVNADLPASGVSAGTYGSVTVDAKGLVTAGTNPTYTMTVQKFTSTAAWNRPTGCKAIKATIVGDGGGGGGTPVATTSTVSVGGCGGAGTEATCYIDVSGLSDTAATVTMTIASPCVVSWATHGFKLGQIVVFTTTGALPTGVTAGQDYYVSELTSAGSFKISATWSNGAPGSNVNTSGSQSGTHTGTARASINVNIGTGGAGGTGGASPTAGVAGAGSSLSGYCTAPGGSGGAVGMAAASTANIAAGGAGGAAATTSAGTLLGATTGASGDAGIRLSATAYATGRGGSTRFGGGGASIVNTANVAGNAGTGYGSGGSGGVTKSTSGFAGGAGAPGFAIIEEHY